MAENPQNPGVVTNTFTKGMVKDFNDTFVGEGLWTHARNAVNNSHDGQVGVIGNEPANLHCVTLPYDLIGAIHIVDDEWAIYTTDDVNSEIGIFDESKCTYRKVINDPCLNFKRSNLITGISRKRFDCKRPVYWADGLNPDRFLDLDNVPYICRPKQVAVDVYNFTIQRKPSIGVPCGQNFSYQGTKGTYSYNVELGSTRGIVTLNFQAFDIPDRFRVVYDGQEVINTGFRGSAAFNGQLANQGLPAVVGSGQGSVTFNKQKTLSSATVYVDAPLNGTRWTATLSCPVPTGNEPPLPNSTDISYIDKDGLRQVVELAPGAQITICADPASLKITNPSDYIVTPSNVSCGSYITDAVDATGCVQEECSDRLDCEKIRLAPLIKQPCIKLEKGRAAGTLPNGSYQVAIAYTINQVKVSDYIGITEVQSVFDHDNVSSSLEVTVLDIDENFDEFELVLIAQVNQQTIARRVGYYSTSQGTIYIDTLSNESISVPITDIVLRTEPVEKSDAMFLVNNYALRVGVYTKTQFNYQPQANKIETRWVATEYPASYYSKAGNNTSYMRDEQYSFFIRWIYNTGERSESYHIPGRAATPQDMEVVYGSDAYETQEGLQVKRWQVENTATIESQTVSILPDGGKVIASGKMGYWESSEQYPDNKPDIWGDLCGQPIRHHKFPDETISSNGALNLFSEQNDAIRLLGVQFSNITHPLDNYGNPIASIVGYEILRGSRQGNKTILAKGMFNNMRSYTVPGNSGLEGLYQNYPYNDLRPDSYLTAQFQSGSDGEPKPDSPKLTGYKKNIFSFHSPETTFTNPYIDASELKMYQEIGGTARGKFITPYKHPKLKLPTNFTDTLTSLLGIIKTIADLVALATAADPVINLTSTEDIPFTQSLVTPHRQDIVSGNLVAGTGAWGVLTPGAAAKRQIANSIITGANFLVMATLATVKADITAEQYFKLILALVPYKQYAAQYVSHGFYNEFKNMPQDSRRRKVVNTSFVKSDVQVFGPKHQINNQNRGKFVAVEIPDPANLADLSIDNSRFLISGVPVNGGVTGGSLDTVYSSHISAYYGALKIPLVAQYGQLDSIKQLPISVCISPTIPDKSKTYTSEVFFGGDTYINRFTEKNTMLFFNTWLMGEPNGTEFDYTMYFSLPYARFWVNNTNLSGGLFNLSSEYRVLDYRKSKGFHVERGYFYLFNSGVRDFYVESEVNVAYRDWEDVPSKRHYDPYQYTDLNLMFRSDIIKEPNFYKYDYSLSIGKLFNSQISWGNMLPRDFDPQLAERCFSYYPDRVIYSLPQQLESKKDNWRIYLANNYKDFISPVTSIKSVNRTGALFMMKRQSPMQFMGVEELKMDGTGAKITIGDGALFNQPLQAVVNADDSYEYGSCQNKFATLNCVHGVFWVSQDQGKVFQFAGGLKEISRDGMKWWFAKYLPSELLKVYPTYPLFDNMLKGIGVQMIYDNTHEIVYITKRDYKPKMLDLLYDEGGFYKMVNNGKVYYPFTDTTAWEDASWTISYDPKSQTWISFHDWKPTFLLPGKAHFMSVDSDSIYKHNVRCDLFCNFYGLDYPFDIEFVSATGQTVNSVRNIEYLLEAYKFHNNCADKYHVLDANFDQAMVYNSEQVSGVLELELKNKTNPVAMLSYPQVGPQSIKINFSKEEQKYRFNQFWDITKNRGEFTPVNIPMFVTNANGYEYVINPAYVNYQKSPLERKKFRHNVNRVFLRKFKSGDVKLLFKISNQKLLQSPR